MTAPQILIAQHRAIEALFAELADETRAGLRARLSARLAEEMIAHMAGEEAVFYPAARQALRGQRVSLDARDQKLTLRLQLRRFLETNESDESFASRLATLREVFDRHVLTQERELFPRVEAILGTAEVEALGLEVLASRPPVWIVMSEGQARFASSGSRTARARVSLPSTR
jgi:hemerythrin superfamily protein